jgi:hypothetical protein
MATVEQEIIKPLPDPTAGLELVTGDEINLEATRHVFLAADLMDPQRSRDVGMPDGGEELENRCLRRTSGRIPRCYITPMELWVEWLPLDLFPVGMEHMALKIKGAEIEPSGRIFKPLFGYPYYPGHLIIDAVGIATGERRGVVELENLRGVNEGKEVDALRNLFFPANYRKPLLLSETRNHIEKVAASVADPDAKDTANFLLLSCDQSREYMEGVVSTINTQLDQRVVSGPGYSYTYRLTAKGRHFMAQLGIKPRSEPAVQVKEAVDQAVGQALAAQPGLTAEMLTGLGTAIGNAIKDAFAAAPKPAEEPVEAPKAPKSK